jgi:hypothetical protein
MNEIEVVDQNTGEILPALPRDEPRADPQARADFDKTRDTVREVIDQSMEVLRVAAEVAIQSQNFKSVESYAKLVDSVTNATQSLLDARIKYETAIAVSDPEPAPQTVNNNLFVGSVDDFLKRLKPQQDDEDADLDL